jgi:hypothetical protein
MMACNLESMACNGVDLMQRTDSFGNGLSDAAANPSFGQPQAAAPPYAARRLQFSARVTF